MKALTCPNCGAAEWEEKDGYQVCTYCGSKLVITADEQAPKKCEIALNSDVERLLKKCDEDPKHAAKYANLILDIDPTNKEALKYI